MQRRTQSVDTLSNDRCLGGGVWFLTSSRMQGVWLAVSAGPEDVHGTMRMDVMLHYLCICTQAVLSWLYLALKDD
jgi:hypothetical protein